ncbi:MAG: tRNA lysidine(34) synthetase TilS [Lachnospiraceae bacterium]|nr:tRNA lysidine(34) synthetase TilS [Lachnospiraceae bacterium]
MEGTLSVRVRDCMREYDMVRAGDTVVAGLSGGADSVCLTAVLAQLAPEMGFSLRAVHVHHGLRGESADADAAAAQELCRTLGIPCETVFVDVPAWARAKGLGTEEAARELRYRALREAAEKAFCEAAPAGHSSREGSALTPAEPANIGKSGPFCEPGAENRTACEADAAETPGAPRVRIAVAHHREDQAETVLFRLVRGSGLTGLAGMSPVNGDIIRPLLFAGREEILAYLREQCLSWREDETNAQETYARNFLRLRVMPLLEEVNEGAARHVAEAAESLREASEFLEGEAARFLKENARGRSCAGPGEESPEEDSSAASEEKKHQGCIEAVSEVDASQECAGASRIEEAYKIADPAAALSALPDALRREVLRRMLPESGRRDVTRRHILEAENLLRAGVGKRIDLPGGRIFERTYDDLVCREAAQETETSAISPVTIVPGAENGPVTAFVRPYAGEKVPENRYTKWFDCDKINGDIVLRSRRSGDWFLLPGGGRKSVKSYMIDQKIPREERDGVPVVAVGDHVLWIVGYRICESVKVTPQTRRILELRATGGKNEQEGTNRGPHS